MIDTQFLEEIKVLCEATAANFDQVRNEFEGLIGNDVIVAHFVIVGSAPSYPDTLGEVFALSKKCVYDYEIRKTGPACYVFFLDSISEIVERHATDEFFEVHFHTVAGAGLMLIDKKEKRDQMREFCMKVKDRILETKG